MSAQEKKLAELQDQIQSGLAIASGGDPTSQVEPRAALADMKAAYANLIKLSRLDTNNRWHRDCRSTSRRSLVDECMARIAELDELLAKEATAGRDLSEAAYRSGLWWILGVTIAGVVVGGLVAVLVTRSITRPVSEVRNLAQAMANGDLRQRIQLRQQDEVGQLSDATNALADSLTPDRDRDPEGLRRAGRLGERPLRRVEPVAVAERARVAQGDQRRQRVGAIVDRTSARWPPPPRR